MILLRPIPSVMVCELYPMSKGEKVSIKSKKEFYYNIDNYCCVFEVKFTGVHSRVMFDNPISASKCYNLKNAVLNNGRIVSADEFCISMTNVDFRVYEKFYKYSERLCFNTLTLLTTLTTPRSEIPVEPISPLLGVLPSLLTTLSTHFYPSEKPHFRPRKCPKTTREDEFSKSLHVLPETRVCFRIIVLSLPF